MLHGNVDLAYAPLIVERYKSIPALKVARLIELAASGPASRNEHLGAAGIALDAAGAAELYDHITTILKIAERHGITIRDLSKPDLTADERELLAIRDEATITTNNSVDGAGISPPHLLHNAPDGHKDTCLIQSLWAAAIAKRLGAGHSDMERDLSGQHNMGQRGA